MNGTEVSVDVIITSDTNLTTSRKVSEIPQSIERIEHMTSRSESGCKLVSVESPGDCLVAAACIICDVFWGDMKKKIRRRELISIPSDAVTKDPRQRELNAVSVGRATVAGAIKVCDTIKKYTEMGKFGVSVGIPLPAPVKTVCDNLNPCKWFCPKASNLRGCTEVRIVTLIITR